MKLRRILYTLIGIVAIVILLGAGAFYFTTDRLAQFGAASEGARRVAIEQSPNFDGRRFINPNGFRDDFSSIGFLFKTAKKWLAGGEDREPDRELAVAPLDAGSFNDSTATGLRVTWLGHSTCLIEMDGYRILTDPMWAERSSPTTLWGPKRFHPIPLAIDQLPRINAVVISHDHYDHLDMHAVQTLAQRGVLFYVPLGVGADLEYWGVDSAQIVEMDWWKRSTRDGRLTFIATPAVHFSGRSLLPGRDATQWSSWAIIGPRHRVFFGGDTGEFDDLSRIGSDFGPFDITLLPIGAYDDLWPEIHLTPEQAVKAHRRLQGTIMLPIHWGTFDLAFHDWFEPPERLLRIGAVAGIRFAIPRPGEAVSPDGSPLPVEPWWREYMPEGKRTKDSH